MKELSKEILNTYNLWRTDERFDKETRDELNKPMSNEEIEDRFWRDLEFGTGGLRGVMGAGTKHPNARENPFGGGVGAGIKVTPVAFLVIKDGNVRMLPVAIPANTTTDRLVEMIPDTLDKVVSFIDSKTKKPE